MSRREYLRRMRRRRSTQKKKNVVWISLVAVLVVVLAVSGFVVYSRIKDNQSGETNEASAGSPPAVASEPVVSAAETDVAPVTAPTPEPDPTPAPREKAVALTFDDGPSRENTGKILDVLKKYGAHATFFVLGDRARVDGDLLKQELEAGCEIGSHSWNHPQLSKISWSDVKSQVSRTDNIVKKMTDGYQIKLLRPPYGAISDTMRKKLKKPDSRPSLKKKKPYTWGGPIK